MTQKEPSCFNGVVRVKKYRITIEEIDEPIEVVTTRLEKLWVESDNHHDYKPLQKVAKELNYEFVNKYGSKKVGTHY